ncbi:DUF427 domain [Pyrenophora seminiperda CCB06]|uniref:DUF427 domain n=1 Tax=Pyrenophora seminiperda CCB06 TaxID=1302712 RepID=A0A3M7M7A9_9PLEO|nr:DUF427 domain [Pyrenophora seminiperda CCB06]
MPHATATVNGVVVAETDSWEVVDGNIYVSWSLFLPPTLTSSPCYTSYTHPLDPPSNKSQPPQFPPDAIKSSHFSPTSTKTHCPYKGDASYYTVTTNKTEVKDAAWFYPTPLESMNKIKGFVAFYKGKPGVEVKSE